MAVQMTPVGATARWIAAARALETESATPLFSDPYARALAGEEGFKVLELMRMAMGPGAPTAGPDLYLSLRTRFLDDGLLKTVRERALQQVVLLAAGMDTRAVAVERIERAGGGKTLQHALVDRFRIHARGKVGEIAEWALAARLQDRLDCLTADTL